VARRLSISGVTRRFNLVHWSPTDISCQAMATERTKPGIFTSATSHLSEMMCNTVGPNATTNMELISIPVFRVLPLLCPGFLSRFTLMVAGGTPL